MLKGQYLTIEQLLIVLMSIFILSSVVYTYNSAERTAKIVTANDQFKEAAELVLSHVVYAYNSGKNSNVSTELLFDVPVKLSSQVYSINLSKSDVLIKSLENPNVNLTVPVGYINESVSEIRGNATSINGRVKINYDISANIIVLGDI